MENEQWLEEAVLATNRSLRVMPDSVLRRSIKTCREYGISLESVAGAGNEMGVISSNKLTELRETIPEPAKARLQTSDIRAIKQTHREEIESCRFMTNYMTGATREITVILDLHPTDEKDNENIKRIMGGMADRIIQDERKSGKGGENGNRHNRSS